MDDQFACVNGYRLRYRLDGQGPLAVVGHGLLGSLDQIAEQFNALSGLRNRLRLLTYDARGHGASDGPTESGGYTWSDLGRDMLSFAQNVAGEERAIFGGGSMGAATALWVAVEHPEAVRGLVLVMPPPLGPPRDRGPQEESAIQFLDFLAAAIQNYGLEKTAELVAMFPGVASSPDAAQERTAWLLAQSPLALAHATRGLIQSPGHDPARYREIHVPTLILAHEGDGLHPARSAHLLADAIDGSRLRIAPDPGWWPAHPAEFLAEIDAFLDHVP